jgi:hypothetical protein
MSKNWTFFAAGSKNGHAPWHCGWMEKGNEECCCSKKTAHAILVLVIISAIGNWASLFEKQEMRDRITLYEKVLKTNGSILTPLGTLK